MSHSDEPGSPQLGLPGPHGKISPKTPHLPTPGGTDRRPAAFSAAIAIVAMDADRSQGTLRVDTLSESHSYPMPDQARLDAALLLGSIPATKLMAPTLTDPAKLVLTATVQAVTGAIATAPLASLERRLVDVTAQTAAGTTYNVTLADEAAAGQLVTALSPWLIHPSLAWGTPPAYVVNASAGPPIQLVFLLRLA